MSNKQSGVLLHITSLPGREQGGTLGSEARAFVDFLKKAGVSWWQVLPVGPVGYGESPYQSGCAFAGNPLMIDLETLYREGMIPELPPEAEPARKVDFEALRRQKEPYLRMAFDGRKEKLRRTHAFDKWCGKWTWLRDYALFMALKEHFGGISWMEWPDQDIRLRKEAAMERYAAQLREEMEYHMFLQFLFRGQWEKLRHYANKKGIRIMGDMPIYVAEDSADVWSNPEIFRLDARRRPTSVAGVPPDYFSADGQLWGNPLYRWDVLKETGYDFWVRRMTAMTELYDMVRIDHFIGFANYYTVKAGSANARAGHWKIGPGMDLFNCLKEKVPGVEVVAEDLGAVNARVRRLLKESGYPGMKVLQFGYDGTAKTNPHHPSHVVENCLVYTGTHDNDTTLGWWNTRDEETRKNVFLDLGFVHDGTVVKAMMRRAMMSPARLAVLPMQDVLGLDGSCRMNLPSTLGSHNWTWRMLPGEASPEKAALLRKMNRESGRLPVRGSDRA